jgi:hypothetical protein
MSKPKIRKIKTNLIGTNVPHRASGRTGKFIEDIHAKAGMAVQPGKGPDYPDYNLEMKSKSTESTSAFSIGRMTKNDILNTDYKDSNIKNKMQHQYHVYHTDGVIVKQEVYDFTSEFIQEEIETAYETARKKLANGDAGWVKGSKFGHFEANTDDPDSYQFRVPVGAMQTLKNISTSTIDKFFKRK